MKVILGFIYLINFFGSGPDKIRYFFFGIVICIAEHHTLVTGTGIQFTFVSMLSFFQGTVNTLSNIRRLLINRCQDRACLIVKSGITSVISDLLNSFTNDRRDIYISACSDLTHNKDHTCCAGRLTCNSCLRVISNDRIKDSIGDLITDLIRMSFRNRF